MRRSWLCLCAVLIGGVVHADQRPKPTDDLKGEIAWARATWPDELKHIKFASPVAGLLSWAPRRGETSAYVYTSEFACQRVVLSRETPDASNTMPALVGRIYHRPRREAELWGDYTILSVGRTLSREDGPYDPIVFGALSFVDKRVAYFDGEPQVAHTYCNGPPEWLPCAAGGEHPCERCEVVGLIVFQAPTGPGEGWGVGHGYGTRPVSCHDPCPAYPEGPDRRRIEKLIADVDLWLPRHALLADVPSLYKSRDECLREHHDAAKDGARHRD
jgi:hypothetical protein